jgi:L-iditol 2-dehydrogenase
VRALLLADYGRFAYTEVPTPVPARDEVLVQVRACGICGSDVHGMDGSTGRRRPPLVMGHEAAGVVAEAGDDVSGWEPGARVTFDSTISCGACAFCREGLVNLCDMRRVLGVSCEDYRQDGAFAEYVTVPARILYRLPDELDFVPATMVETLAVALHALERARVVEGETAVVVGTGMVGLLVVQALLAHGARVIGVDVDPARLELAASFGAEVVAGDASEVAAAVRRSTGGRGADVAVEVVGESAPLRTAVEAVRKGGRIALVGNLSPEVGLPLQAVVTRELTLYGSAASAGEYERAIALLASGTVDVRPLITAVAPLAEGASWFERLHAREPGLVKVVLEPSG